MSHLSLMGLLLAVTANSLLAQMPPKPKRLPPGPKPTEFAPKVGTPKPFTVPARERFTLPNGMEVSLVPYGTAPMVHLRAIIQAGNLNESKDQIALADLMGELMKEGAAGKSSQQLAEEASSMGGQLDLNVGSDTSTVTLTVLGEFGPNGLRLLSDVLRKPDFPESDFERVRANMLRQTAVMKSRPSMLAEDALAKALFGEEHPYGRNVIPDETLLKKFTLADVKAFYNKEFGAQRTRLYVVGQFDATAVKAAINAQFADWQKGPAVFRSIPKTEAKRQFIVKERAGSEQAVLRFATPISLVPGDKDFIPFTVLNNLLGGSFISRITSNIREEKGYTYSPGSRVAANNFKSTYWVHNSEVANKFTGPAMGEILKEINRLRAEPPPEDELTRIKNEQNGMFVLRNSSLNGVASQLAQLDQQGLSDDYLRNYIQNVGAVKREDLQRLSEVYLNPNRMTVVVVGDTTKIGKDLEPFKKAP
jgi:zinc protease